MTSPDGKAEFQEQVHAPMKGLIDIIEENEIKITFDHFIEVASLLKVRKMNR